MGGTRKQEGHGQRADDEDVEQDRRGGEGGIALDGIEGRAEERDHGHEQQIGEGDPRQRDRELEHGRVGAEARRQQPHQPGHQGQGQRQQDDLNDQLDGEEPVGEEAGRLGALLLGDLGIGRHIGLVDGALAEDRAEMIGQAQRHRKGVHRRAGAQHGRQHDIAHEPGDPRDQRIAADRRKCS